MAASSPASAPACGRAGCACPHDDCDRGWIETAGDKVRPCYVCRPEYEPTGIRSCADRDVWLAVSRQRMDTAHPRRGRSRAA